MGTDNRGSITSRANVFSSSLHPKAWRTWHQQICTAGFFPQESYHTRGMELKEWPNHNLHAIIHTKNVTVNKPNAICRHLYLSISAREHNQRINIYIYKIYIICCFVMFKNCHKHLENNSISHSERKARFRIQTIFRRYYNYTFIEF
jgi:hypothetical protein